MFELLIVVVCLAGIVVFASAANVVLPKGQRR